MQFARDAHQAEGWLLTQEPYLKKDEEKNAVCSSFTFSINRNINKYNRTYTCTRNADNGLAKLTQRIPVVLGTLVLFVLSRSVCAVHKMR